MKKNKNIILISTLVIILVTLFAPKIIDLTGKGTFVATSGVAKDYEPIIIIDAFGAIKPITTDFDPILYNSNDQFAYGLTDSKIIKIDLSDKNVVKSKTVSLDIITIDSAANKIYGINSGKLYKIDDSLTINNEISKPTDWKYDSVGRTLCSNADRYIRYYFTTSISPIRIGNYIYVAGFQRDNRKGFKHGTGCERENNYYYKPAIYKYKLPDLTYIESYSLTDYGGEDVMRNTEAMIKIDDSTLITAANGKIHILKLPAGDTPITELIAVDTGCDMKSNFILDEDYLYFICGNEVKTFHLTAQGLSTSNELYAGLELNSKNAFVVTNNYIYYGDNGGNLIVYDKDTIRSVTNRLDLFALADEKITALAIAISDDSIENDAIYIGTNKGNILALNPNDLNGDNKPDLTEMWDVNVGTKPVNSIIIPYENAMLAVVAEENKLFLFEKRLSIPCVPPCDSNEACVDEVCVFISCDDSGDISHYYIDGKNPFVQGTTEGTHPTHGVVLSYTDSCVEQGSLAEGIPGEVREWYCGENNNLLHKIIECPEGSTCISGACEPFTGTYPPDFECEDKDLDSVYFPEGKNYWSKKEAKGIGPHGDIITREDYCTEDGKLKEFYCDPNDELKIITYNCLSTQPCVSGACGGTAPPSGEPTLSHSIKTFTIAGTDYHFHKWIYEAGNCIIYYPASSASAAKPTLEYRITYIGTNPYHFWLIQGTANSMINNCGIGGG